MLVVKGMRFQVEVILVCIRWYAAYLWIILQWAVGLFGFYHCLNIFSESISARLGEAGGCTFFYQYQMHLEIPLSRCRQEWQNYHFLLTAKHDKAAAKSFFDKAMQGNGVPEKISMDKSGANKAAITEINASREVPILVRQVKYLNNTVEQDHRAVKRITKPMLGLISFHQLKISCLTSNSCTWFAKVSWWWKEQKRWLLLNNFMLW